MRFSVKSCLYSFGYRKHRERIKIIVDGVRPVFDVNRYFVLEQIGRGGQTSASIYYVCIYLNYPYVNHPFSQIPGGIEDTHKAHTE